MRVPRPALALLLALLLLPSSGVQEGARAEAEGPPAPESDAPSVPMSSAHHATTLDGVRFDPSTVRLDDASPEQQMRAAFDENEAARAQAIGNAALPNASTASRGRILWLLARSDNASDVVQALTRLADAGHPLSRWAALRLGEALLTRTPARALSLAENLTQDWAGAPRARMLQALAQRRMGEDRAAQALLRAQLDRTSNTAAAANLAFPLAEILVARGDRESLKQALALYRRVGARAALSDIGERADKLAAQVLARMRPKDRADFAKPTSEEQFARGQALMNGHHFEDALALFDKLARSLRRDRDGKCRAELEAGHALFMKRDRVQAHQRLTKVARRCSEIEVKAWAHYYAASALVRTGDPKGAIVEYEALVRSAPEHSLADDALYLEAQAQQDTGDSAAMRAVLERMLERYPHGDMRAEGRFSLVLAARARRDYPEALAQLDALLAEGPGERQEGSEGRAAYWRARTLQDLGRSDDARAAYIDLARALPLSYHAQQAMARLYEIDRPMHATLLAELADDAHEPKLTFAWRPELDAAAFKAALELMRVGEVDLAQQELAWLGATGRTADRDMLWLVAAMLHEAHAYADASNLVRSRLRMFRSVAPRGQSRPAVAPGVSARVRAADRASGGRVAGAGRVRARRCARRERLQPGRGELGARLRVDPADPPDGARTRTRARSAERSAVAQATRGQSAHWRALHRASSGSAMARNPAVVPAAYNAGLDASRPLVGRNPRPHLDDWIERIPYRETRRYTRRVLQTYGVYAWLDTGRLPPLPLTLPGTPAPEPAGVVLADAPSVTPAKAPAVAPAPSASAPPTSPPAPVAAPAAIRKARAGGPSTPAGSAAKSTPAPRRRASRRSRVAVPKVQESPAIAEEPAEEPEEEPSEDPADPEEPVMRISPHAED